MLKKMFWLAIWFITIGVAGLGGYWWANRTNESGFPSPLAFPPDPPKPLLAYTIPNLAQRQYQPSTLTIESVISEEDAYTAYVFSYQTQGKKMTGQLNVPTELPAEPKAIIMLRGYVPPGIFTTGVGTRNAAAYLAEHGFITLAPDFFGYGGSDPEPTDEWQARFEKPISVIELIKTVETKPIVIPADLEPNQNPQSILATGIGLWGHSNGGQIALSTLEILGQSIPTTLWAPVTAPFPYSILFFSDEVEDEGKAMRVWLHQFEALYDAFDFSLTRHLDRLHGPLQLHHGTADDAALVAWSNEFIDKLETENLRRELEAKAVATLSAQPDELPGSLQPIEFTYFTYPGADHNLQPGWDVVVERDLEFFQEHL